MSFAEPRADASTTIPDKLTGLLRNYWIPTVGCVLCNIENFQSTSEAIDHLEEEHGYTIKRHAETPRGMKWAVIVIDSIQEPARK